MTNENTLLDEVELRIDMIEAELKSTAEWLGSYLNNSNMPTDEKVKSIIAKGDELKNIHARWLELTNLKNRLCK